MNTINDRVFTEPAMRPPQEARSLLLRATQGCSYNECAFCYVSRGYSFFAVTPEQLEAEVAAKKSSFSADTKVYLTGSNPFVLPAEKLSAYVDILVRHIPGCSGISMQARIQDVSEKSAQELRELRAGGLTHLYIGVESGNDAALKLINKGHSAAEAVEQLNRLEEAGIDYITYYILGMAGKGQAQASAKATADMFNRVTPLRITTTGMTIFPNTPLADMVRSGNFVEASEREKIEELLAFLEQLETDTFFDAVHYLNPLNYRFETKRGKAEVIDDIKDFLATHSDDEMELMVSRHLMSSL